MSEAEDTEHAQEPPAQWLEEPYVVVVNYQASEVNNASWLVYKEETAGKLVMTAFCVAFVVTVFASLSYLGIFTKSPLPDSPYQTWIALSLLMAVILVPPLFACWLWQLIKANQLDTYARERRYRSPITYTLSSAGFQWSTDSMTMLSPWTEVSACYELAQSLTLYSDNTIIPLPKRCFASAEQLKKVRKLIIESGVAYSTLGPQQADIVFTGSNLTTNANREKAQSEMGATESAELRSDATEWQPSTQTLTIQCSYSLKELTEVDKKLFFKYSLTLLGLRYIGFMLIGYCYSWFMLYILGEKTGSEFNKILFSYAPLIIPIFFIHARVIFEQRIENLRELVNLDLPVYITFSNDELAIRSRRNLIANKWANFLNCFATKDHYICRAISATVIIPKSALDSRSKEIYVEKILRTKIKRYEEWS